MPKKISSLLQREWGSPYESAIVIGGLAFFSQFLILLRDRVLAHYFGTGHTLDVFYAATRIPDLLFVLVASSVSVVIFLPALLRHASENETQARKFVNDTFSVILTTFVLISVCVGFAAPFLSRYLFPGFDIATQQEVVLVMRVLLVVPVLFALTNLLGSVTQMLNRFFIFAMSSSLYTLGIWLGAILFYPAFGIVGLAIGTVVGAFLSFFVHFYISARNDYIPAISWRPSYLDIWEIIRSAFPRVLALAMTQLTLLFLVAFATKMEVGSVAIFSIAFGLQMLAVIVGISFTTAAFPGSTKHTANEDPQKFVAQIVIAARRILFWSIPVALLFIVLRAQIVRVFLGSGQFDWTATRLVVAALAIFAVSTPAQSLLVLFTRGFHVMGNKVISFIASVCAALSVGIFAFGLSSAYVRSAPFQNFIASFLRVDSVPGVHVLVLPMAYSLGIFVGLAILVYFFKKCFSGVTTEQVRITFFESLFSSLVAGFVAYEFLAVLGIYLDLHTFRGIFLQGFFASLAGILAWWSTLEIMQNEDIQEFRATLGSRFAKVGIILPGQEEI